MVTQHLTENVSVFPVLFTDMENMVSEATSWVGRYGVATDAITFIWVKLMDIKSVEEMWVISMHGADLSQASEYLLLVFKYLENLAWFSSW